MNINTKRYFDACSISPSKKPFLKKWYDWNCNLFNKVFHSEWELYNKTSFDYVCELLENHPEYGGGCWTQTQEYKELDEALNPIKVHKILWRITSFPNTLHSWLCCVGWNEEDKETDRHMLTLLACNAKLTWWDKLRYYLITGYKYEEN